jgi:hypothetical protein
MNVSKSSAFPGGFQFPMTEVEAKYILGLEEKEKITDEDVNRAFAKMITSNHPDTGGISRRVELLE